MVLKEKMLCKCYNSDVPISYCAKRVSFKDKISSVGFEFLPPKGLLVQVLFWGLGVISSVCSIDVHFLGAKN
jgi:hypothetical protein